MKITFLGTSHGVPAPDRHCSSCMVGVNNSVYLIDTGAPVTDLVMRNGRDIDDVRAVFTTHVHGDHTAGLFQLCDLINWYYRSHAIDIFIPEQPFIDALKNLILAATPTRPIDENRIRFKINDESACYEDENVKVSFIRTQHMCEPHKSYAVLLEADGKRVLFSGDLSHLLQAKDVPNVLFEEEIDAFVCEMAHFGVAEVLPYLDRARVKDVYVTHVYPVEKYAEIEEMANLLFIKIHTPNDGDTFEV